MSGINVILDVEGMIDSSSSDLVIQLSSQHVNIISDVYILLGIHFTPQVGVIT